MTNTSRLAYDKKIQSYSKSVKESLNQYKEAAIATQKTEVAKELFSESKEEGSDDSEELLEGETPAHPAMLFGHQDNIEVFENPAMSVTTFDDHEFTEEEMDELAAELGNEDWDEMDEEIESIDEISSKTLKSYTQKAKADYHKKQDDGDAEGKKAHDFDSRATDAEKKVHVQNALAQYKAAGKRNNQIHKANQILKKRGDL